MGLGANSIEGARVTQLEINYKNFYFAQDKSDEKVNAQRKYIDPQTQIVILTILNFSGEREASLTVTFAYAPTILNNGSDSEPLVLQIVNTGSDTITLNENSRFEITIDAQGDREEPWAFAKKDEAIKFKVFLKNNPNQKYWLIEEPKQNLEDPTWIIKPNFAGNQEDEEQDRVKKFTFKQNEDFFITISNLKSSLRPGIGNLYVAYYNLPGYKDRKRILNVTKTCITERKESGAGDGRIGINKYPDSETQLDVKGKIASDSLDVKGEAVANFLTVKNTVRARKFEGEGAFVTGMIMMWSGAADALPYGWALCDGTKGTPNLKGNFILSAGDGYNPNTTGGSKQHNYKVEVIGHQLTLAEIPEHKHNYRIANRFDGKPSEGRDHGDGGFYWTDAIQHRSEWGNSRDKRLANLVCR
ncbi:MAG: tail fiber protein [Leptolyngbyaceae cyanobacterium SM1_4_3]|nr:tail fiber protein [Leptolyngbyaceae cyanobacterium SM1_4_3]